MQRPFAPALLRGRRLAMVKAQGLAIGVDSDTVALFEFSFENFNRERVLNQTLDGSLQRPRPISRIIALGGQQGFGAIGNFECDLSARQVLAQPLELNLD